MATFNNDNLKWIQLDGASLPGAMGKAYAKLRQAYADVAAMREEFDTALVKALGPTIPQGHTMVVSHRFGKLSVATKEGSRGRTASSSNQPQSLVAYLKQNGVDV